jgi:hypothetical protein
MANHCVSHPDVVVTFHGSLVLFRIISPEAKSFVNEYVSEDRQFFGDSLCVEPRYVGELIEGMRQQGLAVEL